MRVLTVISDPDNFGFFRLKASCAIKGLELIAIVCEQHTFVNNRVKDDLLKDYLAGLDEEEIVMFSDGYDTLLLAGEEEILEKFYQAETDLLVSAETNCFPEKSLASDYPACETPYRYLNCGGFIGRVRAIREFLSLEATGQDDRHAWSNQYVWTLRYLRHTHLIKLDVRCEIFCTFYTVITLYPSPDDAKRDRKTYSRIYSEWFYRNFSIREGRIYNKMTGTWPCNAHFNGVSSLFLDDYPVGTQILYAQLTDNRKAPLVQVDAHSLQKQYSKI